MRPIVGGHKCIFLLMHRQDVKQKQKNNTTKNPETIFVSSYPIILVHLSVTAILKLWSAGQEVLSGVLLTTPLYENHSSHPGLTITSN